MSRRKAKHKAKQVPFRHLNGRIDTFDPDRCQRFGLGPGGGGDPDEPAVILEAPEFTVTGRPGRYFGWTRWGHDPGAIARSAAMPTREEAAENLRDAIRAVRRLMMGPGDRDEAQAAADEDPGAPPPAASDQ